MIKNIKTRPKLFLGFSIPIALMIIIASIVYYNVERLLKNSHWVEHTYEVMAKADHLSKLLIDMETGQRGFLIAGKEEFLEPYNRGLESWSREIEDLKKTVSDNPAQVARLEGIDQTKREWVTNAAEKEINQRRKVSEGEDAQQTFKKLQGRTVGKDIFDGIRAILADLDDKFAKTGSSYGRNLITKITLDLVNMETGQRGFLLTGQEPSLEPYIHGYDSLTTNVTILKALAQQTPGMTLAEVENLKAEVERWQNDAANPEISARRDVNAHQTTMDDVVAMIEAGTGKQYMDSLRVALTEFSDIEKGLMDVRKEDASAAASSTITITMIGTAIAIATSVFFALLVSRQLVASIRQTLVGLKEIASGNLTYRFHDINKDEIGEMMAEINTTNQKLENIMASVQEVSENVASASTQIASANTDLAQRTQEQVGNIEETSVSMEMMASSVSKNASSTMKVYELSSESSTKAVRGNDVVSDTIQAMKGISESSKQIADIINVIDEIAFQTNLLALNAAVEAARAGEQGRGFAVVASEVRILAQRSASAAKEIKDLIQDSLVKVSNGSQLVDQTGLTFEKILNGIKTVADISSKVSDSSQEQRSGINQVNTSMSEIDRMTQENSVLVEEMDSACQSLKSQSDDLRAMIKQFKVSKSSQHSFALAD